MTRDAGIIQLGSHESLAFCIHNTTEIPIIILIITYNKPVNKLDL